MGVHCIRLHPGQDLVPALLEAASQAAVQKATDQEEQSVNPCSSSMSPASAVFVVTCVGSLDQLTVRLAGAAAKTTCSSNTPNTNTSTTTIADGTTTTQSLTDHSPLKTWNEPLEIVSLVGTLAVTQPSLVARTTPTTKTEDASLTTGGSLTSSQEEQQQDFVVHKHLHISVSTVTGEVWGGHLMAGRVLTTVELVLGTAPSLSFDRRLDPRTGYRELHILEQPRGPSKRLLPANQAEQETHSTSATAK